MQHALFLTLAAAVLPVAAIGQDTPVVERTPHHHHHHRRAYYRYCRHSSGTAGLIAGGAGGALLGHALVGGPVGTVAGAVGGAFGGRAIDRTITAKKRCR